LRQPAYNGDEAHTRALRATKVITSKSFHPCAGLITEMYCRLIAWIWMEDDTNALVV